MRILFLGDVVGRDARDEILARVPELRRSCNLDAVIVDVDNAAHGFGITGQICEEFYKAGVDCLTGGNHVWDQREIIPHIERDPRLLRPLNYSAAAPGRGSYMIETPRGLKILVVHLMARLFMETVDSPFAAMEKVLGEYRLGKNVNAIFVDFHGEATSEKQAMGLYCDGRVSFVVGTHTHVPTADARILPKGTGYQTDAGMCGNYESVLGMDSHAVRRDCRH